MAKFNRIKHLKTHSKSLKRKLKTFVWLVGERAFVSFLAIIFLAFLAGGLLFYRYAYIVAHQDFEIEAHVIELDENLYEQFLENYAARRAKFQEAESKEYTNPFTSNPAKDETYW